MHTRNVFIADLPKLMLDMVRQQFVGDARINVHVLHSVTFESLAQQDSIDVLMLPQTHNNVQSVNAFLHQHPCSRILFVSDDNESLEVIELKVDQRRLETFSANTMHELFYSNTELCSCDLPSKGLN